VPKKEGWDLPTRRCNARRSGLPEERAQGRTAVAGRNIWPAPCVSLTMGCLVVLVLLVLVLGTGMFLTVGLIGLLMTLIVAGLIGWAADAVVPGKLPGGWFGAVLAGLVGGWLGHLVFTWLRLPSLGLVIAGVDLVPAFVGAVVIAFALELFSTRRRLT
jgi:uncharacterized membrane protein YeaQ/YmgE (transglycosylase-associated protein family)